MFPASELNSTVLLPLCHHFYPESYYIKTISALLYSPSEYDLPNKEAEVGVFTV